MSKCENNIKISLKERGLEAVDWIHLAEDIEQWRAVVNSLVNLRVLWKGELPRLVALSLSKKTLPHKDSSSSSSSSSSSGASGYHSSSRNEIQKGDLLTCGEVAVKFNTWACRTLR